MAGTHPAVFKAVLVAAGFNVDRVGDSRNLSEKGFKTPNTIDSERRFFHDLTLYLRSGGIIRLEGPYVIRSRKVVFSLTLPCVRDYFAYLFGLRF